MSLAGIMAEELYFGDNKIGTGCGRDLGRANSIAKQMVQNFAMNDFGYMVIDEGQYVSHRISEVKIKYKNMKMFFLAKKKPKNPKNI